MTVGNWRYSGAPHGDGIDVEDMLAVWDLSEFLAVDDVFEANRAIVSAAGGRRGGEGCFRKVVL